MVLPLHNEEGNVHSVINEIRASQPDAEIVAVDDASTDATLERLRELENINVVCLKKNLGQSAALYAGMHAARGRICVLMDGDGQIDPADISRLLEELKNCDVVCGYREKRQDQWAKRYGSRIANAVRGSILSDGIRDTGCSLKAFPREYVRYLVPFNGLHRFLPAIFKSAGLSIREIPIKHRERLTGESKYSVSSSFARGLRGLRDTFGVRWLIARHLRWKVDPHK